MDISLNCPAGSVGKVSFSIKGYSTVAVPLDNLRKGSNIIRLDRQAIELSEVVVYGGDPVMIGGNAVRFPFIVTEVFVRENGKWLLSSLVFTKTLGE